MGTAEAFDLTPNVLSCIASHVKYKSLNRKINVLCFSNLSKCSLQHSQTLGTAFHLLKTALEQATLAAYPRPLNSCKRVLARSGLSPCW